MLRYAEVLLEKIRNYFEFGPVVYTYSFCRLSLYKLRTNYLLRQLVSQFFHIDVKERVAFSEICIC